MTSNITYDSILTTITSQEALAIAVPTFYGLYTTFKNFHKVLKFLYHQLGIEWPFKTSKLFNATISAHKDVEPKLFMDLDSRLPKILISYPRKFVDDALAYHKEMNPEKRNSMNAMTLQRFNELPPPSNIPREFFEKYGIFIDRTQPWCNVPDINTMRGDRDIDTTYLIAVPGRGKTETIIKHCSGCAPSLQMICISFRVGEASKLYADFKHLGFKYYKDIKSHYINLKEHPRIIIQIDSLPRLRGVFDGILILDEIESIFEHIHQSPLMINPESSANILASLSKNAFHVFVADANCSSSTIDFMVEICQRPLRYSFFYKNETIRNIRKIFLLNGKADLVNRAIQKLLAGERVYIPTNSRIFAVYAAQKIAEACPNLRIKVFDKTTPLITKDINGNPVDPVSDFINYDCVICTPVLQAGNSFTPAHFHHCFAYASGASNSPEGFSQLIMRVRSVIDNDLYLYVDNRLGPNKKVDRTINSFNDMMDKYRTKNRLYCDEHDIHIGKQIMKLRWTVDDIIDLRNPLTFIEIMSAYNLNEGYKNYTDRLLSILRSYGFEFEASLVTDDEQSRKAEIALNKDIKAMAKQQELEHCNQISVVSLPSKEQADDIIGRMRQEQHGEVATKMVASTDSSGETVYQKVEAPVTDTERVQITKYNLFVKNDIKLPDTANPEQILNAKKFVHKRRLINSFIPLVMIPRISQLDPERCPKIVDYMLRDIDQRMNRIIETPDLEPNISTKRYIKLKNTDKPLYHSFIINFLNILGFDYVFFHPSIVDISKTKPLLSADLKLNLQKYGNIFGTDRASASNMGGKNMMQWLNANLDMYGIKLKRVSNNSEQWYIESPWQLVVEINQVKVRHQDETSRPTEEYKQAFNDDFVTLLSSYIDLPIFTPTFGECVFMDPSYGGELRIVDKVSWNHHISKAKREKNREILTLAKKIKETEDIINRFEKVRENNPSLRWDIFKQDVERERANN